MAAGFVWLVAGALLSEPRPTVDFGRDVVPVLTRLGCNSGACHGKSSGRNGFRLSLFGENPDADHEAIAREGRGRRVLPGRAEGSLILRKPTGQAPHGGGVRLLVDSPEYSTLARWVAEGAKGPTSEKPIPASGRLVVEPERGVLGNGREQPVRALVRRPGAPDLDVSRLARFDSLAPDLIEVDEWGLARAKDGVGEGAIAARFGGEIALARFVVPLDRSLPEPGSSNSEHLVDRWVDRRLRSLGAPASPACTDSEFARRSALDIGGVLPTPAEVRTFEEDHGPNRKARWARRWLDRPEAADRWAMTWSALLRNQRTLGPPSTPGTFALHEWLRRSFAEGRPFDQVVGDLLTARGDPATNPAVVWYRNKPTPEELAEDAAQIFLGARIQCARCHKHPFERWTTDDYRGLAAFFGTVGRKFVDDPATPAIFVERQSGDFVPRWLGGAPLTGLKPGDDPREAFADWVRRPDNPALARSVVNRTWKQFMGVGLVEPEDDLRESNPPTHPELLDAMAADFIANGYDLRRLILLIVTSDAYGRSSLPTGGNEADRLGYGRFTARRLPAEVLLDAIDVLTGAPTTYEGLPRGTRAVQLPDEGFDTPGGFLKSFGRPQRATACECERSTEAGLAQGLLLLNGEEIEAKVSHPEGRAARLAKDDRPPELWIDELYRVAFSRSPTADEMVACREHLARRTAEGRVREGIEDIVWALLNTKEFQFVQ